MTRQTAKDFHPEVLKLFDKYVHGLLPRRAFRKSADVRYEAFIAACLSRRTT
jgi:hypothetical protein